MREQGHGTVVDTTRVGGIRGVGDRSGYAASKHGVAGLTRGSGVEYGRFGISVKAIAPGAIVTPMVEASLKQIDPVNREAAGKEFVSVNPTKRSGGPVAAFLLSDQSSSSNATVVAIDGGQSEKY
ncbi:Dehydrogenases with different specificities (related to short-chain alcohol dehydrogenases) [Marinactinospora thermotolerans DSM 45154]|uniref:Dehydrogenases with different specificities (Related to short-chain alcohol dehydrogenases) n=2 Tax=Marinactinospora thermotolerans TaxID=531310 RepID=A0A1T4T239_9ACTN|nr:Dehydrogenases with different specificities (related to short-chain alcohol dehydrogenases) [Marinactinospora thermotolerans DSM 45154]